MEYYAGLDVSLKEISVCVVDADGIAIERGTCPADPEGVAGWFATAVSSPDGSYTRAGCSRSGCSAG